MGSERLRRGDNICSIFVFLYIIGLRALSGMIEIFIDSLFTFSSMSGFIVLPSTVAERDSSNSDEMKHERAVDGPDSIVLFAMISLL
jgi:hypothetical protein